MHRAWSDMSDTETTHDVHDHWLINTAGGLCVGLAVFVFLVSWDFVLGAGVSVLLLLLGLIFVPPMRTVIKPPASRVTGTFLAGAALLCGAAGVLLGPTIAANAVVVAAGALMAVLGMIVALLGAVVWHDRFGLLVAATNTAALALCVWLFVTDRIPMGYGP